MKLQFWSFSTVVILAAFQFSNCLKAKRSPFDLNKPSGLMGFSLLILGSARSSNLSVVSTDPAADSTDALIANAFTIKFSNAVKADTLTTTSITVTDTTTNTNLPLTYTSSDVNVKVAHNPLIAGRKYSLTIKSGDSGVISTDGTKLAADYSIRFTTASVVNYSGPNGMNFNSNVNARNPYLISRNSKLYAFWSELVSGIYQLKGREIDFVSNSQAVINNTAAINNEIYVAPLNHNSNLYLYYQISNVNQITKFNSNLNWTANANLPTCSSAFEFRVLSQDTNLYLIEDESGCYTNRVVRVYNSTDDGTTWSSIVGGAVLLESMERTLVCITFPILFILIQICMQHLSVDAIQLAL